MRLEEIARLAGVSRSTVSRVVNGEPNVNDATRKRVLQVIEQHEFRPNTAARALASRRSQVIALVISQAVGAVFSDPYFPMLIQGISAACTERDYNLMLSFVAPDASDAYRRIVRGGHLDGLLVGSALMSDSFVDRLIAEAFPFVLIGRSAVHPDVSSVDADNGRGATMVVEHLVRLGYTRIATITGPLQMVAAVDRRDGYLAALSRSGLTASEQYIREGDWSEWGGTRAMSALLQCQPRPDAVFAANDVMAIGALKVIRAAGLRVPEDIALVGFDDIPLASSVEPALTTVRQPIDRLGYSSAAVLIDSLLRPTTTENGAPAAQRIVLPTELVVRESCGQALRYRALVRPALTPSTPAQEVPSANT